MAKKGLPERHHIYLTFLTNHPGVALPERLRSRYPTDMTVALQCQFWDLEASKEGFAVTLSFSGVRDRLFVPYDAVTLFGDPKMNFAMDFRGFRKSDGSTHTSEGR